MTFYTGTAVASKPYIILGTANYASGLSVAGTWDAAPTVLQLYGLGVRTTPIGGMVEIKTQTASNVATIDFVNGVNGVVLDDTFDDYELHISALVPATDDAFAWLRIGTGGTPTYQTSGYSSGGAVNFSSGAATNIQFASVGQMTLSMNTVSNGVGNASGEHFECVISFSNPEKSTRT